MTLHLSKAALSDCLREMNTWKPTMPLLIAFAKQRPGPEGTASGNTEAVRSAYNSLFNLEKIGIADDARQFYLHVCHDAETETPYSIKKPTQNYGKTHQRVIKGTFAENQKMMAIVGPGSYKLASDFGAKAKKYLGLKAPLDLRPLVLFHYWNNIGKAKTVGDLWTRFVDEFGVDKAPFGELFTCKGLTDPLPLEDSPDLPDIRALFLPSEFGSDLMDAAFWKRFKGLLQQRLAEEKWQGQQHALVSQVTAALMHDQALFMLGSPGTGKTTLVRQAILPALREAYGLEKGLDFAVFSVTPSTTIPDLFGFQGLDGQWVMGPLSEALLQPVNEGGPPAGEASDDGSDEDEGEPAPLEARPPCLLFIDEANRIDIEGLLSPLQGQFDRMQARLDPGTVQLGQSSYTLPRRVWRIFAGNSPAADIGRKEQSRPFKRRMSVVIPPNPMDEMLETATKFRKMALELLERATKHKDIEVSQPATALYGIWKDQPEPSERLRQVLLACRGLPIVAVSVGLVESIILRTAALHAIGVEAPLDLALSQSLIGLLAGPVPEIEQIASLAAELSLSSFGRAVNEVLLHKGNGATALDVDPAL